MLGPRMSTWLGRIILISGLLAILGMALTWAFRYEIRYRRLQTPIEEAAARYGIPPHLIGAVIWQETRFQSQCRGKAGEIGLMQIMPRSAAEWARAEHVPSFEAGALFNPATNILAGTWYLARALRRWSSEADPIPYALAEYNAGRSNALRWGRAAEAGAQPFLVSVDYRSTREYIQSILRTYTSFGKPWERWR